MSNELLKSVMNNIARKNLKETDYSSSNFNYKSNSNYKSNPEDKYEMQKNIAVSKYRSNKQYGEVKDLNDLAKEIRGSSREENTRSIQSEERLSNKNRELTLDQLGKLVAGKEDNNDSKSTKTDKYIMKKDEKKFSLDSLTESIKKNI